MSEEAGQIDLDLPPAYPSQFTARRLAGWRGLARARVSLLASLFLMIAGGGIAGAATTHYFRSKDRISVVWVSVEVSAEPAPAVRILDGQAHLDGILAIANTATQPIAVMEINMVPAAVYFRNQRDSEVIEPGTTSSIPVTVVLACPRTQSSMLDMTASLTVGVKTDSRTIGSTHIPFDGGQWIPQMLQACATPS